MFGQSDECFQDYADFVSLFGDVVSVNRLVSVDTRGTVSLHFVLVRGNASFLKK